MTDSTDITEVLAAMAREHACFAAGTLPDMRNVAAALARVDINDVCPESGLTPLLWTIEHDSPLFSFILTRAPDVSARGTGDFDLTPVELASAKGLVERAEQLVRHGAACPPEIAESMAARREKAARLLAEHKQIERTLERALKDSAFTGFAERYGEVFGVAPGKLRGRKGHLSFKNVPVRKLAAAAGQSEAAWLADRNREAMAAGFSLFAADPVEEKTRIELCLAPTKQVRDVVAISRLLTDEIASPVERMAHADILDALAADYPFALVSCGRWGVFGVPDPLPEDTAHLAGRLFDICGELLGHYQSEHNRARKILPPAPYPSRDEVLPALAADLKTEGVFWLPWGVEL